MIKKLKLSAFEGAIRTGGFFGWYLTVMFLCQSNAGSADLLESVNQTFLLSGAITVFVILLAMIFIDFEGVLADKYLRWIPGLFMAESGIALCLSEARTMTLFAAIAGVSAGIGALAMISSLLRVKVSQRIFSVGAGLAIGGIVRVIGNLIIDLWGSRNSAGEIVVSVLIGIIAAVTVHTAGFSKEPKPLVARAEAKPKEILRKIPAVYFWVFALGCAFMFCFCTLEERCSDAITLDLAFSNKYYNEIAYIAFALVAVIAVFIVKPHALASLFASSAALAACSALLLGLRSPTQGEAVIITVLCFAAFACYKMCMYLIVVTFSLDRPHPLFYALFGYGVITAAEWLGRVVKEHAEGDVYRSVVAVLLVLIPIGAFFISRAMRYSGFSQEQLEKRHRIRQLITRISAEKELSDREKTMLNLAVLDGYSADMMPDKLGISRNTVKTQLRALTAKFEASTLEEITENLYKMIDEEEEQLRIEAEQKAEENSVLAALAAQDAAAEEKFERGEDAEAESAEAETEENTEEAEMEEKPENEAEKKPAENIQPAVIDLSELDKKEEEKAQEPVSEPEEEPSEEVPETSEQETAEETESAENEKPRKLLDKAAIRVIRKKNKGKEDENAPEKPEEEKNETEAPKDRLDELASEMDDED